jgi:hypothetical protein
MAVSRLERADAVAGKEVIEGICYDPILCFHRI